MENQSRLDPFIAIKLELLSRFNLVNFPAHFNVCLYVFLMLVSCNSKPQNSIDPTIDFVSEVKEPTTVPVSTAERAPEENIALQTRIPFITPLQTPQLTLEPERISVIALTPETEISDITGQLFIYDSNGIQQVALLDHVKEYLLTKGADWIDWGAHFAQNRKNVAYWTKTVNGTELW